jgi:hypothetical protein
MKTAEITFSKTETIFKCCLAAASIAVAIYLVGNIDMHQFMLNILEWDSI